MIISELISCPIGVRFISAASINIPPEPQNGSSIVPSCIPVRLIIALASWGWRDVGWFWGRLWAFLSS